jgi:Cu/Ag efflux protein CusF
MIYRLSILLVPFVFAAGLNLQTAKAANPVPLGIDLGPSGPVMPGGGEGEPRMAEQSRPMQMAHEGHNDVHGTGMVKAVDAAAKKITVAHQPMSKIGWPAMTMDFAVAPTVDLSAVKPDARIDFSMVQGEGGMYVIQSIAPSRGGR